MGTTLLHLMSLVFHDLHCTSSRYSVSEWFLRYPMAWTGDDDEEGGVNGGGRYRGERGCNVTLWLRPDMVDYMASDFIVVA